MKVTKETGHVVNQQFEIMNSSGYVNHRSDYVNQLTERLFALQQKQLLCDMSLTADDGKLLVHSCVLAAASDFIANQFEQLAQLQIDMTHMPRMEYSISVPDCDVATLQLALRLLYTGDVQHLVDVADWHRVVNVCTSLGVNLNDFSSSAGNHQQVSISQIDVPSNAVSIPTEDLNFTTDSVTGSQRETFVVIERQPSSPSEHNKSSLAAISRDVSGSSGQHTCSQCGKRYRSARYLRAHQLSHSGLKPLLCDTCGRGFYARVNLNRHVLLRHHTGPVLRHVCDRCGKGFVAASRLRRHVTEMHDSTTRQRHSCDVCQLTFANAGNLRRHRQLHSAEPRPHMCGICQRSFTQKSSLQAHHRVHDAEARRRAMCVCPVCGKTLSKSTNLRKHLRHHAPPPPSVPS